MQENNYLTVEEVRKQYNELFESANLLIKIELKCWLHYAESRNTNNHKALMFGIYCNVMNTNSYIEQVKYDTIDCSDIGGKDFVLQFLTEGS